MKTEKLSFGGTPITLLASYSALVGVTSMVPALPYLGGGGHVPLSILLCLMSPLVLGTIPGSVASMIGGIIGMWVNPGAYPFGIADAFFQGMVPALFVGMAINGDKYWKAFFTIYALNAVGSEIVPYYYPGPAGNFPNPPQPLYFLSSALFWLPWIVICVSPIGRKYVSRWCRGKDRKKKYFGIFLGTLIGSMCWFLPWSFLYTWIAHIPVEITVSVFLTVYDWWIPLMAGLSAVLSVPLLEAISRLGIRAPPEALWTQT